MDHLAHSFLSEIERFLQAAGMDPTALGKQALGDPSFVFDLRKGRSPSTRTIDKVRSRTHWNSANIKPRDPVILGLCSQGDLNAALLAVGERPGAAPIEAEADGEAA